MIKSEDQAIHHGLKFGSVTTIETSLSHQPPPRQPFFGSGNSCVALGA